MRNDRNFKIYTPVEKPYGDAMYLISEKGEDWYQVQDKYLPDTVKVEYEEDGTIIRTSTDVSTLVPAGRSVAEIKSLPDGFETGEWIFDGKSVIKKIKTHEQIVTEAESEKQAMMAEATTVIAPLQDAVDLGIATPEEESALKEWKKYRVLLNRIDTSAAPDIKWPVKPV